MTLNGPKFWRFWAFLGIVTSHIYLEKYDTNTPSKLPPAMSFHFYQTKCTFFESPRLELSKNIYFYRIKIITRVFRDTFAGKLFFSPETVHFPPKMLKIRHLSRLERFLGSHGKSYLAYGDIDPIL